MSDVAPTIEVKAVELEAEVRQIKTMADGTCNLILNVPEYCIEQVKMLLGWRGLQARVIIAKVSECVGNGEPNETNERPARSPLNVAGG